MFTKKSKQESMNQKLLLAEENQKNVTDYRAHSYSKIFVIWSQKSTFHGIQSIFDVRKSIVVKIIWFCSLCLMGGLCGRFLAKTMSEFLTFQVDTIVEIARDDQIDFPSITFCNMQICGFDSYNLNQSFEKYVAEEDSKMKGSKQIIYEKLAKNNTKTSFFLAKEIFLRQYDNEELSRVLNRNSTPIRNLIVNCKFFGRNCDLQQEFTDFQMGEFTKCYKFTPIVDMADQKKSKTTGKNTGLQLELFLGFKEKCKAPLSSTAGLMLYVHNSTYTLTEEDNAILIRPGTEASIAIDRTFVSKLSEPYSNCIDAKHMESYKMTDLVRQTIDLTGIYTQQYCLQLCYQEFLLKYCNCYDHTLPKFEPANRRSCPKFIDSLYNCQYLIKRLFYNGKNDRHCLKDCPNECEFINYDTTVSTSIYPTSTYLELLNKYEESTKFFNLASSSKAKGSSSTLQSELYKLEADSLLAVNIYYESSAYTRITEKPQTQIEILITNLGGTLGLFLGCSLLSVVEFMELFIDLLYKFVYLKSTRKPKEDFNYDAPLSKEAQAPSKLQKSM